MARSPADPAVAGPGRPLSRASGWPSWWPLALGLLVMAVPTLLSLAQQTWALESGAHGPIVLATGLWLLHYDGLRLKDADGRGSWSLVVPVLLVAIAAYVFGRAYDFISLEAGGMFLAFIAVCIRLWGGERIRRHAFPFVYLAFIVPPPGWLMDKLTIPLKSMVSDVATYVTTALGYPVAQQGVALFVGPYQLLVEDACAGMNSLNGLIAVSLFYIYLMHRASWRYALLLMLVVIPVAIFVNFLRVLALIIITYHFGDAVGQGFIHGTTGIVLFSFAVMLIFAIDKLLRRLLKGRLA